MAVPSILFLTPTRGPTRGDMAIEIAGADFRLPELPPPPGPSSGAPAPTVSVFFGDAPSPLIEVLSSSLLLVAIPAHAAGAVDVVVQNLDDDGEPIPGESVTAAAAFTYAMALLTSEYPSDLVRVVRALLRLLKRDTIAKEINRPVHTDYDDDAGDELNIAKIGAFPGITVMGPKMRENRLYSPNEQPTIALDVDDDGIAESFVETRVPYVVDLIFTLVGVSDRDTECLNLMHNFVLFMHRTKWIWLPLLDGHPELGHARFEFDFTEDGAPQMPGTPNNSNVHQWSAEVLIRGFPIEELSGLATGFVEGTAVPRHAVIQEGKTALEVHIDPAAQIGDD